MLNQGTYLVVTPFFPSNESFVGSYVYDQIKEIQNQSNFSIEIVKVVSYFSLDSDYEFNGFKVNIFKNFDFPYFIFPGLFHSCNKRRFSKFLKNKNITNISFSHSHVSYPAAYLVEDLVCKKIVQHHGLDVLQLLNGRSNLIKKIQRKSLIKNTINQLNKADLNIGVSKLVLEKLSEFKLYHPKGEYVLYNGVDTSKFYPKKTIKNQVFTIGCVANFWEIKDQITLIKSIIILRNKGVNIQARLIGSGLRLKSCKSFVIENSLSENIFFEKEIAHEKLNDFYNEIDLLVLPSYYEALGCVYLESWATNTVFIAVDGQGISELIPDELKLNLLINKSDEFQLSVKINEIINKIINKSINFEFDMRYSIKNTISNFLKENIFHD